MYRLMIVDDSNIIRNRIQRLYNSDTFSLVATATNGDDAVEKFKLLKLRTANSLKLGKSRLISRN